MNRIIPVRQSLLRLEGCEEDTIIDPRFDRADVFPWLGYGILRIAHEDGLHSTHVDEETARRVHLGTGMPLVTWTHMYEPDYEKYLEVQQKLVNDSWLK